MLKRGPQGETAYVNQYFTIRNRTVGTKHVYVGTTRLASKMMKPDGIFEADQYYFHPDHLGSSNYVTDASGALFEHLEYFPFGETWVEESSNTQRTPYLFTSKELDEETDLYYYGARYYDPRTSQFISAEPLLTSKPDKLPQHSELLGAFTYANNNPLAYVDPDGRDALIVVGYAKGAKDRAAELAASNTLKAEIANAGVKVTVVDLHGARSKAEALGRLSTATSSTANAPKSVVVITHGAPGKMAVAKEGEKIKFATSEEIADAAHIREGGALCIIACQVGKNPDAAKASGGVRVFAPNKRLTLYEDSTGQGTVGPHDRSEPDTTPGTFTLPGTNQTILESVLEAEQGASKQRDRSLPSKEKVDIKLEQ